MSESIPLWNLKPSRFQPRAPQFDAEKLLELAQSIQENGLINPVMVFTYDDQDGYMVWELIAGERRSRACMALTLAELFPQHTLADWCARLANVGLTGIGEQERAALCKAQAMIPATVHPGNDLQAIHQIAVIENLDRDDLSPVEEGRAFLGLIEAYGWSQRELAARVNKSQGYVAQRLGLLSLNETAANALNTRVIGMSHARALAAVPEALQAAATEYVIAEVKKDESPATTRQIENQLRALTAFVDPARWEPNDERVYTPQARNRLAVIKMLVGGPHAEERIAKGWGHLRLYDADYEKKNLLTAKPLTIVERDTLYSAVTNALGMRPQDAWQNHTHIEQKTCATCIFAKAQRPATPGISAYCPRWYKNKSDLTTCEGWIDAASGPVVIPVRDYDVRHEFRDGDLIDEPFAYVNDLDAYLTAYEAATNHLIERAAEKEDKAVNGPRLAIREFWDWQQALPLSWRRHSQAHHCQACRYFEPLNGGAPCRFALNPLEDWNGPRAPQMGVLYGPILQALPRCEMFTRKKLPALFQQPGFSIARASRRNLLDWMKAIKGHGSLRSSYYARTYFWRGLFAWLYPGGDGKSYSWDDIASYLYKHWDEIGDGGMATLVDALILEKQAGESYNKGPLSLLNLESGQAEPWMAVAFAERNEEQQNWPEGWQRPWMAKTLMEVFDE